MFFTRRKISRQKYLEEIARKYGHEVVPFSRVYPHFEEISGILNRGFESLDSGLYGRSVSDDIVHLIKVFFTKGGGCILRWGVSLSFVPHKWDKKLQWHRTLKSSHFDLSEFTSSYFHSGDWRKDEELSASVLHGENYLHESLTKLWQRVSQGIDAWFGTALEIDGVLAHAIEQTTRKQTGIVPLPYPELICTFCLARLGRITEAQSALQVFLAKSNETLESIENLKQAMLKIQQR